jgi:hypothetical protein
MVVLFKTPELSNQLSDFDEIFFKGRLLMRLSAYLSLDLEVKNELLWEPVRNW